MQPPRPGGRNGFFGYVGPGPPGGDGSVNEFRLGLDEVPVRLGEDGDGSIGVRPPCLGNALQHVQRKFRRAEVLPQPFLDFFLFFGIFFAHRSL